jgi:hypothetical protein
LVKIYTSEQKLFYITQKEYKVAEMINLQIKIDNLSGAQNII